MDIGHQGEGFSFDNESPRHVEYLRPFQIASRLITCGEFLEFMEDGGYTRPELWLSEGWETVKAQGWNAPLYWHREEGGDWQQYTMRGNVSISAMRETPVCHVSYFEAGGLCPLDREAAADRSRVGSGCRHQRRDSFCPGMQFSRERYSPSPRRIGTCRWNGSATVNGGRVGVDAECLP